MQNSLEPSSPPGWTGTGVGMEVAGDSPVLQSSWSAAHGTGRESKANSVTLLQGRNQRHVYRKVGLHRERYCCGMCGSFEEFRLLDPFWHMSFPTEASLFPCSRNLPSLPPPAWLSLSNCPLVSIITHITSNIYTFLPPPYNKSPFLQKLDNFLGKAKWINKNKNSPNHWIYLDAFPSSSETWVDKKHPLNVLASSFK